MNTVEEQGYIFHEWLTPEEIAKDVQQVAKQISADYSDKEPLFVVVLNGAFVNFDGTYDVVITSDIHEYANYWTYDAPGTTLRITVIEDPGSLCGYRAVATY